jgi:negative regulator of genetic competence, sporulation and motility
MKIEKLTENKIRIILKDADLKDKSWSLNQLLLKPSESQSLLLEILNKAKSECNFDTEGYKLLIEGFFNIDDSYVLTITKYKEKNSNPKRYILAKRKNDNLNNKSLVYSFNDFDDFCNFCNLLNSNKKIVLKNLLKNSILYLYNNTYYLQIEKLNISDNFYNSFVSSILEFSNNLIYNKNFDIKLKEYGKVIIKKNAIQTGIKYFASKE